MSGGALYQLHCRQNLLAGDCVFVNGPYDEFGYIVKPLGDIRDDLQMYLIRGTGHTVTDWPIHDVVSFTDYSNGSSVKAISSYADKFCTGCNRRL